MFLHKLQKKKKKCKTKVLEVIFFNLKCYCVRNSKKKIQIEINIVQLKTNVIGKSS
jgi:hypothetical protein